MLSDSVVGAADWPARSSTGVDGVFSFENSHDLFFPLVAAAPVCTLDLMTNVAIAFPRSPTHLAHAAYDLHLYSEGRFRLGLGTQVRAHVEKRFGARWDKPVRQMREWVLATKAILQSWQDRTRLDFRGEYTTHTLMTPAFDPGPNPYGIPKILVGALGPKMNQMAAEVADGNLVMPFNTERHMPRAHDAGHRTGARRRRPSAGRHRGDHRGDRRRRAFRRGARGGPRREATIAFYASTPAYRAVLDTEGAGELQPELNALSKQGRWADMTSLITDDLMHTIAVLGTPTKWRRRSSAATATATASASTSPATSRATTSSPSSPAPSSRVVVRRRS